MHGNCRSIIMDTKPCESHERMIKNINDLYDLDRKQTEKRNELADKMNGQLGAIKQDVSDIRAKQDAMSTKIDNISARTEQLFDEMDARGNQQSTVTNKLIDALVKFDEDKNKKKWKPENTVALIYALGGGAGSAAV